MRGLFGALGRLACTRGSFALKLMQWDGPLLRHMCRDPLCMEVCQADEQPPDLTPQVLLVLLGGPMGPSIRPLPALESSVA